MPVRIAPSEITIHVTGSTDRATTTKKHAEISDPNEITEITAIATTAKAGKQTKIM